MELKTTREATEIIYLSQRRIAELCNEGEEFPGAIKKGKTWLIPEEELLIYRVNHPKNNNRSKSIEAARKATDAEVMRKFKEAAVPQGGKAEA